MRNPHINASVNSESCIHRLYHHSYRGSSLNSVLFLNPHDSVSPHPESIKTQPLLSARVSSLMSSGADAFDWWWQRATAFLATVSAVWPDTWVVGWHEQRLHKQRAIQSLVYNLIMRWYCSLMEHPSSASVIINSLFLITSCHISRQQIINNISESPLNRTVSTKAVQKNNATVQSWSISNMATDDYVLID